ncbi:hypothetical protein [Streptomyces virginiae]
MSGPEPVDDQADEPEPCCPEEDRYWQPCGLDCRIYDTSAT